MSTFTTLTVHKNASDNYCQRPDDDNLTIQSPGVVKVLIKNWSKLNSCFAACQHLIITGHQECEVK